MLLLGQAQDSSKKTKTKYRGPSPFDFAQGQDDGLKEVKKVASKGRITYIYPWISFGDSP
jgi:hypothetical protein